MRVLTIFLSIITLLIATAIGANYYFWEKQTNRISDLLVKLTTKLAEKDIEFKYDSLTYKGKKAWKIEGELSGVKFFMKGMDIPILSTATVKFSNDLSNGIAEIQTDKELNVEIPVPFVSLKYKVTYPNEPFTLKIVYDSTTSNIFNRSDAIDVDVFSQKIHTVRISDGGFSMIDLVQNIEIQTAGKSFIEVITDLKTSTKLLEIKLAYENNRMYDPLKKIMSAPHNGSMDILFEVQVAKDRISELRMEDIESYKINIKDFDFGNDTGKIQMLGTLSGSKAMMYLPSISITVTIVNYLKLLEVAEADLKDYVNQPDQTNQAKIEKFKNVDFAKIKEYFAQYKSNDTDLKFEITGTNPMDIKISGKPIQQFQKEIQDLVTPPKPLQESVDKYIEDKHLGLEQEGITPAPIPDVQTQQLPEMKVQ